MKNENRNSDGISESVSIILIIAMILILSIVIYALLFGSVGDKYLKKTVYLAGTAAAVDVPLTGNPQIMTFLPRAGDPFYLSGQTKGITGSNVTLKMISPDGQTIYPNTSALSGGLYGKTLFIYPKISATATQCDYAIADSMPSGTFRPMVVGCWTLQTIDTNFPILIDTYKVRISRGRDSLPSACGYIGTASDKFYRADCTAINQSQNGPPLTACTSSPGNMPCSHFGGSTSVSLPNDPTLSFTGKNLALSMWIKPDQASTNTADTSKWYTLLGKGQLVGGVESDNYQIVQIGNQVYFEWTDPTAPPGKQNFHVMTTSGPIVANAWTQVTVSITNGKLSLFTNCVSQPINYYNTNYPTDTAAIGAVDVNLLVNNNNFLVGKQNADTAANSFYFTGDMAGISVYNRGLSTSEIANACTGNYVC
jgi:hypothetical protein